MRLDCTGEPPGELTITATDGVFDNLKAFSIAPAQAPIERPGRKGVAMPIGPVKRSTGTTGPLLKGHMRTISALKVKRKGEAKSFRS
jgi:hypothetical protein